MTEPNEPTTPLSRMRFSWQRDPVGPEEPGEPDEELPRPEVAASAPASLHEQVPAYWDDAPAPSQAEAEPASDQLATRLTDPDDLRRTRSRQGRSRQARPLERRSRQQSTARADTRANASAGAGKSGGRRGRSRSPKGGFDVPPPGGRFSAGRSSHTAVKVTLVLSACLVAVGIVGYLAFSLGFSTMRANTYHLSGADLARYRLSEFPVEQAGRFAADYARLCLTHKGTPGAADQREAQLSRYASSGTDTTCGWNGEGTQTVTDANWTGESEPIDLKGYAGHARMMTVRVLTTAGSRIVTVPVYVADLANADGMRIIGDVGEMPQPNLAAAPEARQPAAVDGALAEALTQGKFFEQFFAAWGESNRPALQRFVTPDATAPTTSGLGGTVSSPAIKEAKVFLPPGEDASDGTYDWKTGMVTEAWVWVDWRSPGAGNGAVETRAYRLQLVKTTQASNPTQEWAVRDVRGGIPDIKGG